MNYEQMSDFEINVLVAKSLGMKVETVIGQGGFTEDYHSRYPHTIWAAECDDTGKQIEPWEQKVFTHSWDDMGPLIQENEIDIEWPEYELGGIGQASKYIHGETGICIRFKDKSSALRAAAIVYLMSKGS